MNLTNEPSPGGNRGKGKRITSNKQDHNLLDLHRPESKLHSRDCPRFDHCSAPLCPLDTKGGSHLAGEAICFILRELVKPTGRANLRGYIREELLDQVTLALPEITSTYSDIKKRLNRCAKLGSKLNNLISSKRKKVA